ncbi:biosynthetic peptidoglycan transglycosylase [Isoptericola sp. b441]|uniref:Biosynthetic peptidoglycan transglycosylase n=1 Tax=Actinotalea lenta TaxID=3064654 RepID=A0ABT9DCT3_9CELL|nr:biosynthetic peptidoglycan transglycosylase [Isoptericola sp. b441]MDO8107023.1 biosynthetic peptidoglycan transglycosylase [Isoptericola sp. b441]
MSPTHVDLAAPPGAVVRRPAIRGRRVPSTRRRRLLVAAVGVPVAIALAVLAAVGALWPMTPAVADAPQRVQAIMAAHGGTRLTALPNPDRVGQALIATEDSRFWSTPGVDPVAVGRVAWATVRGRGDVGGAGLAQQLAKNLYRPSGPAAWREAQQVELAFKLEHAYSRETILRMYLSAVYFGHGYWGLPAAAQGYFGVAPSQLTWGQAAVLAGIVQAPSADDPLKHPDRAAARQGHVLRRLVATGVLTTDQAAAAARRGLQLP